MSKSKIVSCFTNDQKQDIYDQFTEMVKSEAYSTKKEIYSTLSLEWDKSTRTIERVVAEVRNGLTPQKPSDDDSESVESDPATTPPENNQNSSSDLKTSPQTIEYKWRETDTVISVFIDDEIEMIEKTHEKADEILSLIKAGAPETDIIELINVQKFIVQSFDNDKVKYDADRRMLYVYQGKTLTPISNTSIGKYIVEMINEGSKDLDRYIEFVSKIYTNVSYKVVENLWDFMKHNDIKIDKDGYILAFKKIRENWKDCHTGTIDNSVGQVVSMPRNQVEDDPTKTCSSGLHVCAKSYLSHFGGSRVVLCKVHPSAIVSVPIDYNGSKARVCEYEVAKEITHDLDQY